MPAPYCSEGGDIASSARLNAVGLDQKSSRRTHFLFCCSACWNCWAKLLMVVKRVSSQSSDEPGGGRGQKEDIDRWGVPFPDGCWDRVRDGSNQVYWPDRDRHFIRLQAQNANDNPLCALGFCCLGSARPLLIRRNTDWGRITSLSANFLVFRCDRPLRDLQRPRIDTVLISIHGRFRYLFTFTEGTAWYDPSSDLFAGPHTSSFQPLLSFCGIDPLPTPALYICLGARAAPPHHTHLSATRAKPCTSTRTTDVIRIRLRPTRSPAPTPRRLPLSPSDPWSFCSTTRTTKTRLNNRSTHYRPTGPNGLSLGTSAGATVRQ